MKGRSKESKGRRQAYRVVEICHTVSQNYLNVEVVCCDNRVIMDSDIDYVTKCFIEE